MGSLGTGADVSVEIRHDGGCRHLTLARPAVGNALDEDTVAALTTAFDAAVADPAVHTVVLAGHGRHFCTGFDLGELATASDGDLLLRFVRIEQLLQRLWHAPVRTVALVQGRAFGAGADLVTCCDVRVATPAASFAFPGARFGLVLGTRRLAERIGVDAARRIVVGGATLDADAALACGLVSAVCVGGFDEAATAWRDPPACARETVAALHRASRADHRATDLAALVESAARPGLGQRIVEYRERLQAPRPRSD